MLGQGLSLKFIFIHFILDAVDEVLVTNAVQQLVMTVEYLFLNHQLPWGRDRTYILERIDGRLVLQSYAIPHKDCVVHCGAW